MKTDIFVFDLDRSFTPAREDERMIRPVIGGELWAVDPVIRLSLDSRCGSGWGCAGFDRFVSPARSAVTGYHGQKLYGPESPPGSIAGCAFRPPGRLSDLGRRR